MVVPAVAKHSRKHRHNRYCDITVVFFVSVIALVGGWLSVRFLGRYSSISPQSQNGEIKILSDTIMLSSVMDESLANEEDNGYNVRVPLSPVNMQASPEQPHLIYGTAWKKDDTADLVYDALHAGFRYIDTACQPKHYDEEGVGYGWKVAVEKLGISREDIYLQTKFTSLQGQDPHNTPYIHDAKLENQVRQSVHASLRNLQTTYIDTLLLHSPMSTMHETLKVWKVMEESIESGKVRNLGISNCYNIEEFKTIYQEAKVKPRVLQNRFYRKSNFDSELRHLCNELGVQYQSFWTTSANRDVLASPEWKAMAHAKQLTPHTLMYAYMMTLGHTPLSGTKDVKHMEEDVEIMQRLQRGEEVLSEADMKILSSMLGVPSWKG